MSEQFLIPGFLTENFTNKEAIPTDSLCKGLIFIFLTYLLSINFEYTDFLV